MYFKFISVVMMLLAVPFVTESASCDLVRFSKGYFQGSGIVHRGFMEAIRVINRYAYECKVKIYLTSSFRKDDGRKIHGAIVQPSKISNHFVGHAIDMNLIDGSRFCNSKCLGNQSKQSAGVKCFISKIRRNTGLRWGGDFSTPDPVHIDDGLNRRDRNQYNKLFASLQTNCKI